MEYSQAVIKAFVLEGIKTLPDQEIQAQLKPWLGTTVDFQNLQNACHAVETFYRNNGYRMKAILLPQKIVGGVVKIQVVEEK
jgi:hemolysin activation/secretion protein